MVLTYPQINYWAGMKEQRFDEIMQRYRDIMGVVLSYGNTAVYSYGSEEWLVANPKNYTDEYNTNEAVSEFLMCNTDDSHPYGVNLANADNVFADYRRLFDGRCQNITKRQSGICRNTDLCTTKGCRGIEIVCD